MLGRLLKDVSTGMFRPLVVCLSSFDIEALYRGLSKEILAFVPR